MVAERQLFSVLDFVETLAKSGLVTDSSLQSIQDEAHEFEDAKGLAKHLVRAELLTAYQASQLLAGKSKGFQIGRFRILNLLAEDIKNAVFLARDNQMNRQVAIKLIKLNEAGSEDTMKRFFREARITALMDHPNIVRVFDFVEHGGMPHLIMEYFEGRTLQQLIEEFQVIHFRKAIDFIAQAAAGLHHAHAKGIIHRNITPSKLIRDKNGVVKILDMGGSRFQDDEVMNVTKLYSGNSLVGNVEYISPEQCLGDEFDFRSDIYSLGATFYALLTGRAPFSGLPHDVMMAHQIESPIDIGRFQAGVPRDIKAIIARMMAKKPDDRYQSGEEVELALLEVAKNLDKQSAMPAGTAAMPVLVTQAELPKMRVETKAPQRENNLGARQPAALSKPPIATSKPPMQAAAKKGATAPSVKAMKPATAATGIRILPGQAGSAGIFQNSEPPKSRLILFLSIALVLTIVAITVTLFLLMR